MRSLTAALAAALVLLPAAPAWAAGQAPVVVDDTVSYRNTGGIDYLVPALANDSDPDGDTLTYTAVTSPAKGTAYLQGGKLYYKPLLGNTGTDSFTYTVTDGQGNTATGTVTATLWVDPTAPADVAISGSGFTSATLTWSAAARAAGYRVYRSGVLVTETSELTYTATGLSALNSFEYHVVAVNGGGFEGPPSESVYRRYRLQTPFPVAADPTDDPTALFLTWDGSGKVGPWTVYRDGTQVASVMEPQFLDTALVSGRQYSYQVQHVFPSTSREVFPASALSPVVRATPAVLSDIARYFLSRGGSTGDLGLVSVPERIIPGGRQQDHRNGLILQQDSETPFAVEGLVSHMYTSVGGATGDLGFPVAEQENGLRDGWIGQLFEGGSIWRPGWAGPVFVVPRFIEDAWAAAGWEDGALGYPTGDLVELDDGFEQEFEGGAVYGSAATGTRAVSGAMYERYVALGGPGGTLGYPTTGTVCGQRGGGCMQGFEGGYIHWAPGIGDAYATTGPILTAWARTRYQNGGLGYPLTSTICGQRGGGCMQAFQGGYIHWTSKTGAQITSGAILGAWAQARWQNGGLGYPTTSTTCGQRGGGCLQGFQGGYILWSRPSGAWIVSGAILKAYAGQRWHNGRLGYPVTPAMPHQGGVWQLFQGGVITVDSRGRVTIR